MLPPVFMDSSRIQTDVLQLQYQSVAERRNRKQKLERIKQDLTEIKTNEYTGEQQFRHKGRQHSASALNFNVDLKQYS